MYSWDMLFDSDLDDLRCLLAGEEPEFDEYTAWVKDDRAAAERTFERLKAFAREAEGHYPVSVDQDEFEDLLHKSLLFAPEGLPLQPQYEDSPNQLLRALEVLLTENREVVERARYSECELVRAARELNPLVVHSRFDDELLVDDPDAPYVACDCVSADVSMRATLGYYRLDCVEPGEFTGRVRQRGRLWWSTSAAPTSFEDYLFDEVANEYLLGPVPDHFALSYNGHGVNSFALTVRFAVGDLACMFQIGYGGAYGDQDEERETWADVVAVVNRLREAAERSASATERDAHVPRRRRLVFAFSDFRFGPDSRVLQEYRDGQWHPLQLDGAAGQQSESDIFTALELAELAMQRL